MRPHRSPRQAEAPASPPAGQVARRFAVFVVDAVLTHRRALDEAIAEAASKPHATTMPARDRAFARLIATTTLRHLGQIEFVLGRFIEKALPAETGRLKAILATSAAQLLFLDTPPHAAISQAVDIVRLDHHARRFDKLANAVLRKVSAEGKALLADADGVKLDVPAWLWQRWVRTYGEDAARSIAAASLAEAPLDLTVKGDPTEWAATLSGVALASGSVRVREAGRVEDLPGYAEGQWWVQDAAAALPARILAAKPGMTVADLCAAPGGKSAQLAAAGAKVTSVDLSGRRLKRLAENLARLSLDAEVVEADVAAFAAEPSRVAAFDAVLLDAPCSATGTIRRHPDLLRAKGEDEVLRLAGKQLPLLAAASALVRPGGRIVYTTCSLEPEECEQIVEAFLAASPSFRIVPVDPAALGIPATLVTANGYLRTAPHLAFGPPATGDPPPHQATQQVAGRDSVASGMDGFFAACLERWRA